LLAAGALLLTLASAGCGSQLAKANKLAERAAATRHGRQVALTYKKRKPAATARHHYAIQILPVLDRSVGAFDGAVRAASGSPDLTSLGTVCGNQVATIQIMSSFFDGVPHPWAWYTPLGYLHHKTMDVYGYMLGALAACNTATSTDDSGSAATAVADMSTAASKMRQTDNYVRWLTHQP
jgi:hypothetical protein